MKKTFLVTALLACLTLGWLTGCERNLNNAPPPQSKKLAIAWIPKALNNPVFEIGRAGALKKAAELRAATGREIEIVYRGPESSDASEQARIVREVIAAGVDAIAISCNDPEVCKAPIDEAVAAGIPVMTWDADAPASKRFTYLGIDNYQGGKASAALLVRFMGTSGKVAILSGVAGAENLDARVRGFQDGLAAYSGIELVKTVYCNDDAQRGVELVEQVMQENPALTGWFFAGLWPLNQSRGAMPLWEKAAKDRGMVTICFDTLPVELQFLQDGYLQGLIDQKCWGWGYDSVQMIYDHLVMGRKFPAWTDSGMNIITRCNADAMAAMWNSGDFTQVLPDPYGCLR